MEINKDLRISTMTMISQITTNICLSKFYKYIDTTENIIYIEYGQNEPKGEPYKKKKEKKNQKKKKNHFYNQITLNILLDKFVNVKVFNNGRIQMTGIKDQNNCEKIIKLIISEINKLPNDKKLEIVDNEDIKINHSQIVLINSDFDIKMHINNDKLQKIIVERGYYSSYEPLIYPGVNIKYYYNEEKENNGICNCERQCDGKGKNGVCKKITIAVFTSGKIIITGGSKIEHLNTAYKFIKNIIENNKKELIITENKDI